jgi:hypothetical protein
MRTKTSSSEHNTTALHIPLEIWQKITSYPSVGEDYDSLQKLKRLTHFSRAASEEALESRTLVLDCKDKLSQLGRSTNPPAYMGIRVQVSVEPYREWHPLRTALASKIHSLREVELDVHSGSTATRTFMDDILPLDWRALQGHAEWTDWFCNPATTCQPRIAVHGPASVAYPITSVILPQQTGSKQYSVHHYLDMSMTEEATDKWVKDYDLCQYGKMTKNEYNTWLPKQIGQLTKSHYNPSARVTIHLDNCSRSTVRKIRKITKPKKGEEEVNIVCGRQSPSHMDRVIGRIKRLHTLSSQ